MNDINKIKKDVLDIAGRQNKNAYNDLYDYFAKEEKMKRITDLNYHAIADNLLTLYKKKGHVHKDSYVKDVEVHGAGMDVKVAVPLEYITLTIEITGSKDANEEV
jgi:hypothetical protein